MNNLILMSIKTKFAREIFNGNKVFEFRKSSIKDKNLNKKIFIYSSGVDKSIIGYIIVDYILEGNLNYILTRTNNKNNKDIINYFKNSKNCYALHIKENYKFNTPITLNELRQIDNKIVIPQYYRYIKEDEPLYKEIIKRLNENK